MMIQYVLIVNDVLLFLVYHIFSICHKTNGCNKQISNIYVNILKLQAIFPEIFLVTLGIGIRSNNTLVFKD